MNIEVKALIVALLISATFVGSFLGTARIVQSNTSMPSGKSAPKSPRSKIRKSRQEQSCLPLIVRSESFRFAIPIFQRRSCRVNPAAPRESFQSDVYEQYHSAILRPDFARAYSYRNSASCILRSGFKAGVWTKLSSNPRGRTHLRPASSPSSTGSPCLC
jgi:hypothetical protein